MTVRKFVLIEGAIHRRLVLDTEQMDGALLETVKKLLGRLRRRESSAGLPVPGYANVQIAIGIPFVPGPRWSRTKRHQFAAGFISVLEALGLPDAELPMTEQMAEFVGVWEPWTGEEIRKRSFVVVYQGARLRYLAMAADDRQEDGGLHGFIGSTSAQRDLRRLGLTGGRLPDDREERARVVAAMKSVVDEQRGPEQAVHNAIMAARPALVSTRMEEDEAERLADHFGAAMLLNP